MRRANWAMLPLVTLIAACANADDLPHAGSGDGAFANGAQTSQIAKTELGASTTPEASKAEAEPAPDIRWLRCDHPVRPDDTAESLVARLNSAERGMVRGREGFEYPGVIIHAEAEGLRLEVFFTDPELTEVDYVLMREEGRRFLALPESGQGLNMGTPVSVIERVNGGPFDFYGFGWDFGGNVVDWRGGLLGRLGDDCSARISIAPVYGEFTPPNRMLGEGVVSSDDPDLDRENVTIWEMGINYHRD